MSSERKSKLHQQAEQGNPQDIARWATDKPTGGTYYRGKQLARTFGPQTEAEFTNAYRERLNARAAREPATPIKHQDKYGASEGPQLHRLLPDTINRQYILFVLQELFEK